MLEGIYRQIQNGHAVKSLAEPIEVPAKNLGIFTDEVLYSVPLLLYNKQNLRAYTPVVATGAQVPYEKTALNGVNDCVSLEDFETDNFSIGAPYAGV